MLKQGSLFNQPRKNLPPLKPKINKFKKIFIEIIKTALKIAVRLGIEVFCSFIKTIAPFAGHLVSFGLQTLAGVIFDAAEGKKIDSKRTLINVAKGFASTATSSLFTGKPVGKIFGLFTKAKEVGGTAIGLSRSFMTGNPINATIGILKKVGETVTKKFCENMPRAMKVLKISRVVAQSLAKAKEVGKAILNIKTNPEQLLKSGFSFFSPVARKFQNKSLSNLFKGDKPNWNMLQNKQTAKLNQVVNPNYDTNTIFLASKWIYGVKPFKETLGSWKSNIFTYSILFKQKTTNNKPRIRREGTKEIYEAEFNALINASSAGSYYLENISWGKDFGGILRSKQSNMTLDKFKQLNNYKNILKTLSNGNLINKDSIEVFNRRSAFELNKTHHNKILRIYKTRRGVKVGWKREDWLRKTKNFKMFTKGGNTLKASSSIALKLTNPKK